MCNKSINYSNKSNNRNSNKIVIIIFIIKL